MYQLFIIFICGLISIANATSRHVLSMDDSPSRLIRSSGNLTFITAKEFPILKRLSLERLILKNSAIREPHWYANAHELAYCVRGSALVTIFGNLDEHSTFTVSEGQMFYVPSGYLHHIENLNSLNESLSAEFIIAHSHELPESFGLSSAFGAMTDAVLGNTFKLPESAWKNVLKRGEETVIGQKEPVANVDIKDTYLFPNKYKFDVEKMAPPMAVPDGSAKMASSLFWRILEDLSMFSLRVATTGMREPHWHPETAEMGYVAHGQARMTILSKDDKNRMDTYTLKQGDVYYVPRGYPHHIENIGSDEVHILVFFDQSVAGDVGFTGSFSAYSRAVLAATFQCPVNSLPNIAFNAKDAVIVERVNPINN